MTNETQTYAVTEKLQRSFYFLGGLWTYLATGAETGGRFSLIQATVRRGAEPPSHTHTNEDETYYIMDGEVDFWVGDEQFSLKKGDYIHCPKGISHQWKVRTETAMFNFMVAPAGLEHMWRALSIPAASLDLPPMPVGPPPVEFLQKAGVLQQQFGIMNMDNSKLKG